MPGWRPDFAAPRPSAVVRKVKRITISPFAPRLKVQLPCLPNIIPEANHLEDCSSVTFKSDK